MLNPSSVLLPQASLSVILNKIFKPVNLITVNDLTLVLLNPDMPHSYKQRRFRSDLDLQCLSSSMQVCIKTKKKKKKKKNSSSNVIHRHFPQTFFLSAQNIICCNYTCIVIKLFARKCIPRYLKLCIFI